MNFTGPRFCDLCFLPIGEDFPEKYSSNINLEWINEKESYALFKNDKIHNCIVKDDLINRLFCQECNDYHCILDSCFLLHKFCCKLTLVIAPQIIKNYDDTDNSIFSKLKTQQKQLRIKYNKNTYHSSHLIDEFNLYKNNNVLCQSGNQILEFEYYNQLPSLYYPGFSGNYKQKNRILGLLSTLCQKK